MASRQCNSCREHLPLDRYDAMNRTSASGTSYVYVRPKCKGCSNDAARVSVSGADTKGCTGCGLTLALSDFNRSRAGAPRARCKKCQSNDYRDYVSRNREKVSAASRDGKYRRRFGLSALEVDAMFDDVAWSCQSCGIHRDSTPNGCLVLDHDHACCPSETSCGKCIRGVLCTKCNVGLGALGDDPLRVLAPLDYITTRTGLEVRNG